MQKFEFRIRGMDCAEEVDVLRREIGPLVGGESYLAFDSLHGRVSVNGLAVPAVYRCFEMPWALDGKRD